jgi:hypothetical protein
MRLVEAVEERADVFGPFPVYIPLAPEGGLFEIIRGSAIVGFPMEADPDTIHVYFEGNRYGSSELARFADRAKHAAGRCRWYRFDLEDWRREHGDADPPGIEYGYVGFATSAQAFVPAAAVIQVAIYDDDLGFVAPLGPRESELLTSWIGNADPEELVATGRIFDTRREADP